MLVFVALLIVAAQAHGCIVASELQTCKFLNNQCVWPDVTHEQAQELGLVLSGDLRKDVHALDARIGEALAGGGNQPGHKCADEALFYLCARHIRSQMAQECRSACAAYSVRCADGARIGWPLDYAPCRDYTQKCDCMRGVARIEPGKCRSN